MHHLINFYLIFYVLFLKNSLSDSFGGEEGADVLLGDLLGGLEVALLLQLLAVEAVELLFPVLQGLLQLQQLVLVVLPGLVGPELLRRKALTSYRRSLSLSLCLSSRTLSALLRFTSRV